MKNQFFYTRKEEIKIPITGDTSGEFLIDSGKPPYKIETKEYTDSFSLDMVIRSVELEDGRRLILLNDIHERLQEVPQFNKKGEKVGKTKERNTFQSEIYLEPNDSNRFISENARKIDYELGS